MDVEDKPQLSLAYSVMLPRRSLVIICIHNNLDPDQSGQLHEIELSQSLNDNYPNLFVIPMIHNVDVHKTEMYPWWSSIFQVMMSTF